MIFKEEERDLFSVPKEYALVHCISADFALGAGIAVEFAKRGVKTELKDVYRIGNVGDALITSCTDWEGEVSLVTKERYFQKPTLATLESALVALRDLNGFKKLAMPLIGCGLDRLKWTDVSSLIKKVFEGTEVEILVCKKPAGVM